jgi:hypothetical protein
VEQERQIQLLDHQSLTQVVVEQGVTTLEQEEQEAQAEAELEAVRHQEAETELLI